MQFIPIPKHRVVLILWIFHSFSSLDDFPSANLCSAVSGALKWLWNGFLLNGFIHSTVSSTCLITFSCHWVKDPRSSSSSGFTVCRTLLELVLHAASVMQTHRRRWNTRPKFLLSICSVLRGRCLYRIQNKNWAKGLREAQRSSSSSPAPVNHPATPSAAVMPTVFQFIWAEETLPLY